MARGQCILGAGLLAAALTACVSAPDNAPAWFQEQAAQGDSAYPTLRDIPRDTIANTDTAYWAQVENELIAEGRAMKAHPRAEPVPQGQDPAAFAEEARRELEAARLAHPQ